MNTLRAPLLVVALPFVLPAPPILPWFNHFTFSYQAPAAGSAP